MKVDTFGNVTEQKEAVPNRFKFNGQQLDPVTGQYYLRARFYNPVMAQFTQEDVYRGNGLNLYAYCHNNPVYYADPSGYSTLCAAAQQRVSEAIDGGNYGNAIPLEQIKYAGILRGKAANGTITQAEQAQLTWYAEYRNEIMTQQLAIVESAGARDLNPANRGSNAQHAAELLIRNASQGGILAADGSISGGLKVSTWGNVQRVFFGSAPDSKQSLLQTQGRTAHLNIWKVKCLVTI